MRGSNPLSGTTDRKEDMTTDDIYTHIFNHTITRQELADRYNVPLTEVEYWHRIATTLYADAPDLEGVYFDDIFASVVMMEGEVAHV